MVRIIIDKFKISEDFCDEKNDRKRRTTLAWGSNDRRC